MKKKTLILLAVAGVLIISPACGAKRQTESTAAREEITLTPTATPTTEAVSEKEEKNDFDESQNIELTFWGYNLCVPSTWNKNDGSSLNAETYYAESGDAVAMFQLHCSSSPTDDFDFLYSQKEDMMESFGDSFDTFEVMKFETIDVSDTKGLLCSFTGSSSGLDLSGEICFFISESASNLLSVSLIQTDNTEYSYFSDYKKILESIKPYFAESTPTPEPTPGISSYDSGMYKVGVDIPAGEYIVLTTEDRSGYFSVTSDANGDDILFNENFDYNSIVTICDGEYIKLSHARAYPYDQWHIQNTLDTTQDGCMLKIGVDLPAGEYKLEATSDRSGYYCLYPDSRQQDIIANDNFEGQCYVNVSDGQYLILNRCKISQ